MTRRRVALVVDHPQRDLPGLVLLADRLAASGVDVYLVPLNLLGAEIAALGPDFVLMNFLRRHIGSVIGAAKAAGIAYGILDTEGGFYGDLDVYGGTYVTDRDLLEGTSVLCAWGRRVADYVVARGLFEPRQVEVTGVPRFDFYAPRWRPFFVDAGDDRPMLLFNTKVAVGNPQHQTIEQEMKLYIDKLGYSAEQVERYRSIGIASIASILELANRLARERPAARVVLRPHPHERLSTYEEGVDGDLPNLEVRREGTVDGWIVRSQALIHRQCTTAIEAGFAGVPAIAPMWIPTAADAPDTEQVSILVDDHDELAALLDAVERGEDVVPPEVRSRLDSIIDEWLLAVDGASFERVATAVLDHLPDRAGGVRPRALERMFYRFHEPATSLKGLAGRVGMAATRVGGRTAVARRLHPAAAAWDAGPKAFSAEDVRATLERLHEVESRDAPRPRVTTAEDEGSYRWGYEGRSIVIGAAT